MPGTTLLLSLLTASGFVFQPLGQFHDDEPVVRDGERMFALHVDGSGARLEATTVTMQRVADPMLDEPDGPETGWQVGPEEAGSLIGYLRGAGLRSGELVTGSHASDDPLPAGPVQIDFAGQRHLISTACDAEPTRAGENAPQAQCRITLSDASGRTGTLATMRGHAADDGTMLLGDDAMPRLLFAGDLDRDGRLDLIFDVTDHYNVSRPTLFLSSGAADDTPLRAAARYESVGC